MNVERFFFQRIFVSPETDNEETSKDDETKNNAKAEIDDDQETEVRNDEEAKEVDDVQDQAEDDEEETEGQEGPERPEGQEAAEGRKGGTI